MNRADRRLQRVEGVEHAILVVRGERLILDRDLARLYGVTRAP